MQKQANKREKRKEIGRKQKRGKQIGKKREKQGKDVKEKRKKIWREGVKEIWKKQQEQKREKNIYKQQKNYEGKGTQIRRESKQEFP